MPGGAAQVGERAPENCRQLARSEPLPFSQLPTAATANSKAVALIFPGEKNCLILSRRKKVVEENELPYDECCTRLDEARVEFRRFNRKIRAGSCKSGLREQAVGACPGVRFECGA